MILCCWSAFQEANQAHTLKDKVVLRILVQRFCSYIVPVRPFSGWALGQQRDGFTVCPPAKHLFRRGECGARAAQEVPLLQLGHCESPVR